MNFFVNYTQYNFDYNIDTFNLIGNERNVVDFRK